MPNHLPSPGRRLRLALTATCLFGFASISFGAGPTRTFAVPAGDALATLQEFSTQAGTDARLLYSADAVSGVRTNAAKGDYAPAEALDLMLSGTVLTALQDQGTGVLTVRRKSDPSPESGPAPAAADRAAGAAASSEVVQLDPFQVQTNKDNSYGAVNSNSLTGFNVALDHLPISADIFNQAFMQDVGTDTLESTILGYSAGAGLASTTAGATSTSNQPGDRVFGAQIQLRGLTTPSIQRDSFLEIGTLANPGSTSIGQTSTFDIERIDIIDGPQSLLYTGGGGGGVINAISKQARLDSPTFGSLEFRLDEFGSKYSVLDYGASAGNVAVRLSLVDAADDTRRINIGDKLKGGYLQIAGSFLNTIVRFSLEQTSDWHLAGSYLTLTSTGDPAFSSYNANSLTYLLATNQTGNMMGGHLNWSNVSSYEGDYSADSVVTEFGTLVFESKWTDHLTSQISLGLAGFNDDHIGDTQTLNLYSPGATANPIPGNWTMNWSGFPGSDGVRQYLTRAARATVLSENDLFGGKAHSQSVLGADYLGLRGAIIEYDYYQADSNFNIIQTPTPTLAGRTLIPAISWPVTNGPVEYPLFAPLAPRLTYNGVNYVRAIENPVNPALIGPANPIGASIVGGATNQLNVVMTEGAFGMNHTSWLDGKLDTLIGARWERIYSYHLGDLTNPPGNPFFLVSNDSLNFNVGADYHVQPWLAPYFTVSDSHFVDPVLAVNPEGNQLPPSHSVGEEVGLKVHTADGKYSGSFSIYHVGATNQNFVDLGSQTTDINPAGLNGTYNGQRGGQFTADAESEGVQLTMTAAPVKNWRIRFSAAMTDGKFESTTSYPQLYNDQFYENNGGQVTYADGNVVYVPATFNSKTLTVASSTVGAVPLTVTSLSTPGNPYYASPAATNGQITAGSAGGLVLKGGTDPANPASGILTGVTGLPISAYQLNPALTPGLAIPGAIPMATKGNDTIGYPEFAANLTSVYTFDSGPLNGFEVGGTLSTSWENRQYYIYPQGIAAEGPLGAQSLFKLPTLTQFNLILGYTHKFGRITFSTHLNVYNLFNHYAVIVFPDTSAGYTSITNLKANFDQQPRNFALTNTISF